MIEIMLEASSCHMDILLKGSSYSVHVACGYPVQVSSWKVNVLCMWITSNKHCTYANNVGMYHATAKGTMKKLAPPVRHCTAHFSY